MEKPRILTGDRTTGKLHLGHYAGSVQNRIALQNDYDTFLLLADVQALTTHYERPAGLKESLLSIALDYLSAGMDPNSSTIVVQSLVPEIAELTILFSMFVTVNSLRHNPTIKAEAAERGYTDLYYGFLGYPISQAADIAFCKAELVPVGDDNVPHVEQARKIIRRFNDLYTPVLVEPRALVGKVPRLPGLDGDGKMSKSKGNALALDAATQEVKDCLRSAKTDPSRVHKTDPGHPAVCPVFAYHQAFLSPSAEEIRTECTAGTLGCVDCKARIAKGIEDLLEPMRERRAQFTSKRGMVEEILQAGTTRARQVARETMREVRAAMQMEYF